MQRLFDIKKTQLEMVHDRGYNINNEDLILTMTLHQFISHIGDMVNQTKKSIRNVLSNIYTSREKHNGVERNMLVYYAGKPNAKQEVSIETINPFILSLEQYDFQEAILIIDGPLSSASKKKLDELRIKFETQGRLIQWQIFFDSDLAYNPTKHVDTPRHELLSPEEATAKLREMRADFSKLLIIKIDDPIVRYYGWSVGGLVRVYRDDSAVSILAPKSINYRVIIG